MQSNEIHLALYLDLGEQHHLPRPLIRPGVLQHHDLRTRSVSSDIETRPIPPDVIPAFQS